MTDSNPTQYRILILGASYGSLLSTKLMMAGHHVTLVCRDATAEIFNAEGLAYWDGQSSLGGVWITHPNVDQATRVLIKDKYGGKSVIGAIFNRSGDENEKRMLLSSEAAASLGV